MTRRVQPLTVPQPVEWGTSLTDWYDRLILGFEQPLRVTRPGLRVVKY